MGATSVFDAKPIHKNFGPNPLLVRIQSVLRVLLSGRASTSIHVYIPTQWGAYLDTLLFLCLNGC